MPRCLCCVKFIILEPRYITSSKSFCFVIRCDVPKRRNSVLTFFKFITYPFSSNQSAMESISLDSLILMTVVSLSATYIPVSSAYLTILAPSITSVMSLKNMINSKRPKMEPLGAPLSVLDTFC